MTNVMRDFNWFSHENQYTRIFTKYSEWMFHSVKQKSQTFKEHVIKDRYINVCDC